MPEPVGFIADVFGLFLCRHSQGMLKPGIYILLNKVQDFISERGYGEYLRPEELAYFVLAHEAAHMILHSLLPRDIRASYYHREHKPFKYELEEPFCEYAACRVIKDGCLRVLSFELTGLPRLPENTCSVIFSLTRPLPYAYYTSLFKMSLAGLDDYVQKILWAYVWSHSVFKERTVKMTFKKVLERLVICDHLIKTLAGNFGVKTLDQFKDLMPEPCYPYVVRVVI